MSGDRPRELEAPGPLSGPSKAVNFFTRLPPELVLKIALFLDVEDVVSCMLVSTHWHSLLSQLEPYWRAACVRFGLPDRMIMELQTRYSSFKEMLLSARHHRLCLRATPPCFVALTKSYPVSVRYSWLFSRAGKIVGALYEDFKPLEILVDKLHNSRRPLSRENSLTPRFARIAENRVVWVHVSQDFLLCACASGLWSGYDLRSNTLLYRWRGSSMYDSDMRIDCCVKCNMVCTSKLICCHNTDEWPRWEIGVFKLGRTVSEHTPTVMRFELPHQDSDILARRAPYGKRKVCLLSSSSDCDSEGFCRVHRMVLQWANKIVVHTLTSKTNSCILSKHPQATYSVSCNRLDDVLQNGTGLNTEFSLSSDTQLIGVIFRSQLHVWDLTTSQKTSAVRIHLSSYKHEQMRLIAVGHIYSLIGLEFSNKFLVVATQTGRVVVRCSGVGGDESIMVPPWIDFISAVDERWLSDITCPCSTDTPAVLYWNKAFRVIEAIVFGQPAATKDDQTVVGARRPWWKPRWNKS